MLWEKSDSEPPKVPTIEVGKRFVSLPCTDILRINKEDINALQICSVVRMLCTSREHPGGVERKILPLIKQSQPQSCSCISAIKMPRKISRLFFYFTKPRVLSYHNILVFSNFLLAVDFFVA